jgi:Laminin G domain
MNYGGEPLRNRRLWIVTGAVAAMLLPQSGVAGAAGGYSLVRWDMNEPGGARTMSAGSGWGADGTIGDEVTTGGGYYSFDRLEPDTPPAHPAHLVTVRDHDALDPGSRDFAVSVRLRTRSSFGNVVQKGQATVSGGSFKLQIPSGRVQCWYRGTSGQLLVTAPKAINDGQWHTVKCIRDRQGVVLEIDGTTVAEKWGWTGTIANSWPLSIGGKTDCDQISVGCDYFAGDIDYIAVEADDQAW